MSTFMSQQNTQNTVTLGVGTVPTGAAIVVNGVATPGIGNIFATWVTLPGSSLSWKDQTTAIYPSSVTGAVQCGDSIGTDSGPCDTFGMNRNFRTPYVENWTLGIQHAFSGKLSLDATYVGNHAVKLPGVVDFNQTNPLTGVQPFASKFPYVGFINYLSNIYGSTYHRLQTTLTAPNHHGLDLLQTHPYPHPLTTIHSNSAP